ncbi:MAG: polysaccharide deacetylase 2 family uncharacterized protein YibQ [Paraglaciecola sp.]|jgi:polysaccharide deacetylase 2 family uncharacterized protein YibQ
MHRTKFYSALVLFIVTVCRCTWAGEIALIIDDIGNNSHDASAFALPRDVAISILPHKALTGRYALLAADQQREVLLHMPMESISGFKQEPEVLLASMSAKAISHRLQLAFATVPNALGLNNHMGSRLTQLDAPMQVTMHYLQQRGLAFVDSRTTKFSQAQSIAKTNGVVTLRRHVFLDNDLDVGKIDKQFKRLLRLAKKYGQALAIGHPHPQTINYLLRHLPQLGKHNIQLIALSDMLGNIAPVETLPERVDSTDPAYLGTAP